MHEILFALMSGSGTGDVPTFNSTAQIYQIVLQFLLFIVNLFTMGAIFYLVMNGDALDRARERREARKKARNR